MEELDRRTSGTEKSMDRDFEVMDLSPFFREMREGMKKGSAENKPGVKGFTIKIGRTGNSPPKIDVDTFGNMDDNMKKQIREQLRRLGVRDNTGEEKPSKIRELPQEPRRKEFPEPKFTEEPNADVKRLDDRVQVDISLPGVRGMDDIEVTELESSVEVRAFVGEKALFKIITKPEEYALVKKEFSDGNLHLEFA